MTAFDRVSSDDLRTNNKAFEAVSQPSVGNFAKLNNKMQIIKAIIDANHRV
jgi:hypothetical protein